MRQDLALGGIRPGLDMHVVEVFISSSLHIDARWEMSKCRTKPKMAFFWKKLSYKTQTNRIEPFSHCLANVQVFVYAFSIEL